MSAFRLATGGHVDRARPFRFSFDGKSLQGVEGDSLASALLANDVLLLGRSFKYHRPRGVVTAGSAEPNALVTLGRDGRSEPNARATMVELQAGLTAASQNRWPTLAHDFGAVSGLFSPLLGAGFYYKTFMWPKPFWEKVYEPLIRRAAGLGRAGMQADPDSYEKCWLHCDLLVIGAGAAGLSAALTAARAGARVVLADEHFRLGGWLLSESRAIGDESAGEFLRQALEELGASPNVTLLPRTTVFGWYDDNVFGAVEKVQPQGGQMLPEVPVERLWRIVARRAVLASGAEERPLVFGGNDRPGIMTASAMTTYLNRFGVAAGENVAIFATGSAGYRLASALSHCGIGIAALIDPRPDAPDQAPPGVPVLKGASVTGTFGRKRIRAVLAERMGHAQEIACDALAMSGGFSPIIHLACQRGAKPVWSAEKQAFLVQSVTSELRIAGAAAGGTTLSACLASGQAEAVHALADLGFKAHGTPLPAIEAESLPDHMPLWYVPGSRGKAFVDFQNDVHVADLSLAEREAFGSVEHAKRYTTSGMATDQGKLSNVNAAAILAGMRGASIAETGTTTFRPFYTPVSFGAMAGRFRDERARPLRQSPLAGWARKNGARFVEAGLWHRSAWFAREGETQWRQSVDREVLTVRAHAGLCDISTLGKIELFGPDAVEFLNRVYCNSFSGLLVGKARYGMMLREDGMVFDDGTVSRLGEQHFFITTTSGHAEAVLAHLEFAAQVLFPELRVSLLSVADQWAMMALAGPKSRLILEDLVEDDISNAAFPPMSAAYVTLKGGLAARLFRLSFSGELAFELAVPAGCGEAVADTLLEIGAPQGIAAYGVEAMNVLRIEKGFLTHAEMDGRTTPDDLGMGRLFRAQKPDFIGKRLSARFGLTAADRPQLIGLQPLNPEQAFRAGAQLLKEGARASAVNNQGHVTSACHSPVIGSCIGLGLLKSGRERMGETILVWDGLGGSEVLAKVVSPAFVDPENRKMRV
ncbi:sarcosine oxidase subunit alpha family protein [Allorhizobium undicola]|uniref:sarcosine oxidase subunit alpha family protein n=1 Tax=Allorhizobium undicola TaxID=78527 RepID=UPI003D357C74